MVTVGVWRGKIDRESVVKSQSDTTFEDVSIKMIAQSNPPVNRNRKASDFVTLEEAAQIVGKTPHNIRDYIQRGRIGKYNEKGERIERAKNGELRVSLKEVQMF